MDILPLIRMEKNASGYDSVPVTDIYYWRKRLDILTKEFFSNKNPDNFTELSNSMQVSLKSSSESKADKHTSILCQIEDAIKNLYPTFETYLTVYRTGGHSLYYKNAEKKTNRTFYHMKMWSPNQVNIKDPDAIIVEKDLIRFVIEVKWGYLEDYPNETTDLLSIFEPSELNGIISMVQNSEVCRVKGPYIQNGIELKGSETYNFKVNLNTKFLVVSDLKGLKDSNIVVFKSIKDKHKHCINLFSICDIKNKTDIFYSLETYLRMQ